MNPISTGVSKKTLITGGLGTIGYFLGKHLAEQGQEVTLVDNMFRGKRDFEAEELLKMPNVKFIELDVTRAEDFKKLDRDYDFVYHLAAINGTKNFYEIPEKVLKVGVLGVINVLEWFKENKKGKILFTSSNEAYASFINLNGGPIPTPETVPLCIDDVANPRWSYGGGKLIGELFFINYSRAYNFPMSIVRYHNNYGPRMGFDHVIPEFILKIMDKEDPFKTFGTKETRAFCYITDTIRATKLVMESDKTNGQILHIGNDKEEISMGDLLQKMLKLFNYQPNKVEEKEAPQGSVKRRCPDLAKIRKLVGYEPEVSLEDGLKKTYDWYYNRRKLNKK